MAIEDSENTITSRFLDTRLKQKKTFVGIASFMRKALAIVTIVIVSVLASLKTTTNEYSSKNDNENKNSSSNNINNRFMKKIEPPKGKTRLSKFLGQVLVEDGHRRLSEKNGPGIVWLFAFPESGGYHVAKILQIVSQRATATNHGNMYMNPKGVVMGASPTRNSMRVYGKRGPPLLSGADLSPPDHKILTHTDATGSCYNCHPKEYVYNTAAFREHLWTASIIKDGVYKKIEYDTNDVVNGLHLYRYPFDNIVLRYWAHREKKDVSNHNGWVAKYGASNEGFIKWCDIQDKHWYETDLAWYGEEIMELAKNVPCHQEFYKYINYYNNVEKIERGAGLPMKKMCYEEFYNHYHLAVKELINYLELPVVKETPSGGGKDINMGFSQHYFSVEQKNATYTFLKAIAYPGVREMMEMFEENDFSYK